MTRQLWHARLEGEKTTGHAVSLEQLSEGIEHGVWSEVDEVRGPGERDFISIGDHPIAAEYLPLPEMFPPATTEEAESDLTPLIDVIFQLVIFFMIAATYTVQKTLDLPKAEKPTDANQGVAMEQLEQTNVIIKISADGSYVVDGAPVDAEDLVGVLRDAVSQKDNAEVVLDVDDAAEHDAVVKVLDAAGGANVERVLFVTRADTS